MNRFIAALAAAGFGCTLLAMGTHATAAQAADDPLRAAIADSRRTPANVARDPSRHPYETLRFFGITPTMTVAEIWPGGGWYTEILAPYLSKEGKLVSAGSDPKSADEAERKSAQRTADKYAAKPDQFGKIALGVFSPPQNVTIAPAGSLDMVLTFRNIHNWIADLDEKDLKKAFAGIYASLKPGGVFGVVEHRLPENRPQDKSASTGYVHASYVIKLAEEAGFKLAAQSEINANPKDNAEHENGVWALPPTYANKDKDRASYAAIGESDRMTLKFVKVADKSGDKGGAKPAAAKPADKPAAKPATKPAK